METINNQVFRIGYFSDNLRLFETISENDSLNFVNFKIHIDKSELRDLPTDKHLLQSDYFKFNDISYRLLTTEDGATNLVLSCNYKIASKLNGYANLWAKKVVSIVKKISLSFWQEKFCGMEAKNVGDAARRRGFLTKYRAKFDSHKRGSYYLNDT